MSVIEAFYNGYLDLRWLFYQRPENMADVPSLIYGRTPRSLLEVIRAVANWRGGISPSVSPSSLVVSLSASKVFLSLPYTKGASTKLVKTLICSRGVAGPNRAAGASRLREMLPTPTVRKCGSFSGNGMPAHSRVKSLHVPLQSTDWPAACVISWSRY